MMEGGGAHLGSSLPISVDASGILRAWARVFVRGRASSSVVGGGLYWRPWGWVAVSFVFAFAFALRSWVFVVVRGCSLSCRGRSWAVVVVGGQWGRVVVFVCWASVFVCVRLRLVWLSCRGRSVSCLGARFFSWALVGSGGRVGWCASFVGGRARRLSCPSVVSLPRR